VLGRNVALVQSPPWAKEMLGKRNAIMIASLDTVEIVFMLGAIKFTDVNLLKINIMPTKIHRKFERMGII
jgi:hypothetical protein